MLVILLLLMVAVVGSSGPLRAEGRAVAAAVEECREEARVISEIVA